MLNVLVLLGLALHSCFSFPSLDNRKVGDVGLTSSNQYLDNLESRKNGIQQNLDNVRYILKNNFIIYAKSRSLCFL